jgi:hypothetical protein
MTATILRGLGSVAKRAETAPSLTMANFLASASHDTICNGSAAAAGSDAEARPGSGECTAAMGGVRGTRVATEHPRRRRRFADAKNAEGVH